MAAIPITNSPPRLLVIDDDALISDVIKDVAESVGFLVSCIHNGKHVVSELSSFDPHLIFLDLVLPGFDGVEIIDLLRESGCKATLVLMSGLDKRTLASVSNTARIAGLDLHSTVSKPLTVESVNKILHAVRAAVNTGETRPSAELTSHGPLLFIEPCLRLDQFNPRMSTPGAINLLWRLDDDSLVTVDEFIAQSVLPKSGYGVVELTIANLAADGTMTSLKQAEINPCLTLPDSVACDKSLPDILSSTLNRYRIAPDQITVEFSEQIIVSGGQTVLNNLSRLKIKAFRIAVDVQRAMDKVLTMLGTAAVDDLVLDMGYALNESRNLENLEFEFQYSSFVATAKRAGLRVFARSVDNAAQLEFARRCGLAGVRGAVHRLPCIAQEL